MKVNVIKTYRDKYTNTIHKVGENIEMTKERYEEINSTSLGTFVNEVVEKKKKPTTKK